jgi:sec-independent protein translocase protein TatB
MQMFGVGVLELMVILILAVIVVGPDKMPQLAADLARWIRQTRAYAKHLMGDFNEVVSELEKEAGASREDWKEIASVVTRHTGAVGQELSKVTRDIEQAGDLNEIKKTEPASNVVPIEEARTETNGAHANGDGAEAEASPEGAAASDEKPWYVPERASRRRSSE